ncbi:hypothetical protein E2C01_044820 [Portunus trituberculatus]|uniref:Uncharacterized protein n=1 Tax=Portunus trituberculatus TaxID=210409 RepID=A0A5B7G3D5_PORTR|nr:hypothetical protein [Portunus trituberculatus]
MLFCEHKWTVTWCSQQPQSNLIATLSPSLQAFMDAISLQEDALTLLKNHDPAPGALETEAGSQPITAKLPRSVPQPANSNPENSLKRIQFHPQDGAPLTSAPIKNIRKGWKLVKLKQN